MIDVNRPVVAVLHQHIHDFVHVHVPVLQQRLLKVGKRRRNVAEVDDVNALLLHKVRQIRQDVAKLFAAFQPAAAAELDAQIMFVRPQPQLLLNLIGAAQRLAVVVAADDDARAAFIEAHGRIAGMECQLHADFLAHRQRGTQKIFEVVPHGVVVVFLTKGGLAGINLVHVHNAAHCPVGMFARFPPRCADAPRIPCRIADLHPGVAQPAVQIVILGNPFIPVGQTQLNGRVLVDKAVAGIIHRQPCRPNAFQRPVDRVVIRLLVAEHDKAMGDVHLAEIAQIVVRSIRADTKLGFH